MMRMMLTMRTRIFEFDVDTLLTCLLVHMQSFASCFCIAGHHSYVPFMLSLFVVLFFLSIFMFSVLVTLDISRLSCFIKTLLMKHEETFHRFYSKKYPPGKGKKKNTTRLYLQFLCNIPCYTLRSFQKCWSSLNREVDQYFSHSLSINAETCHFQVFFYLICERKLNCFCPLICL